MGTVKGGWAEQSGDVQAGDVLVSVDGRYCSGLDSRAMVNLLIGPVGSAFSLVLEREGDAVCVEGQRVSRPV